MPRMQEMYRNQLADAFSWELEALADERGVLPENAREVATERTIQFMLSDPQFLREYGEEVIRFDLEKRLCQLLNGLTGVWGIGPRALVGSAAWEEQRKRAQKKQAEWFAQK